MDGICATLRIETKGRKRDKVKEIVDALTSERLCEIINGLPDKCKQALTFILTKECWVKYGQLSRKFDSEIGYWWNENPPKSTLGLLRLHRLLFVGRTGIGGRMHTIAAVPAELKKKISECAEGVELHLCAQASSSQGADLFVLDIDSYIRSGGCILQSLGFGFSILRLCIGHAGTRSTEMWQGEMEGEQIGPVN